MKQNFTPLTALIFILLAAVGSASAGDCMKLCDGSFWRKNPTLADVKAEIAKGADIHDDIAGYTPLHFAAKESTPEIIQYLEDQGAKLEAKTRGDTTVPGGHTPLHHAITGWDVARVKAMTKAGADIDSRIDMGMTALYAAAGNGLSEVLKVFIEAGANPLCEDRQGQRPVNLIRPDNRLYRTATHDRLRAIDDKINIAPPIMH